MAQINWRTPTMHPLRITLGLLVLLDVVRHILLFGCGPVVLFNDSLGYWNLGAEIAGGDFFLVESREVFRTPGYPLFLALWQSVGGEHALALTMIVQITLSIATSLLAGWVTFRLSRSAVAGLLAYAVCIAMPARLPLAMHILNESLFTFLLIGFVALLIFVAGKERAAWFVLPGVWWGFAALVRLGPHVLIVPIALLILLVQPLGRRDVSFQFRCRAAAVFVLSFAVMLVPWLVRNQAVFGEVFLTKATGRTLWMSAFDGPNCGGMLAFPDTPEMQQVRQHVGQANIDYRRPWAVINTMRNSSPLDELAADDLMGTVSKQAIMRQPLPFGKSVARRWVVYWGGRPPEFEQSPYPRYQSRPGATYLDQQTWHHPMLADTFIAVTEMIHIRFWPLSLFVSMAALAGAGLLCVRAETRQIGLLCLGLFLGFSLMTSAAVCSAYRFRSALEPMMVVCWIMAGVILLRYRASKQPTPLEDPTISP